jgi:hypothetical protein
MTEEEAFIVAPGGDRNRLEHWVAKDKGGKPTEMEQSKEPIEEVARQLTEDGRTVVFRNFDRGPEQKMLSALETILARFHGPVIITSTVHPVSKAKEESRGRWEAALQTFVRRDVNSHPSWHVPESSVKIPDMIAEEAYYDWLLSGRDKEQKLLLAQVAEQKSSIRTARRLPKN